MKDVISVDTTGGVSSFQELKEKLAAIEHERWADWQKWCHKILRANIKHDIEPTLARWEKQIATPYSKLTRGEQLSDLEQVDRYWPLLLQSIHSLLISKLPEKSEVKYKKWIDGKIVDKKSPVVCPRCLWLSKSYRHCENCGKHINTKEVE